jgi:hypothetical protein
MGFPYLSTESARFVHNGARNHLLGSPVINAATDYLSSSG